jgi:DNA-binding PucR family transcriptional regulator
VSAVRDEPSGALTVRELLEHSGLGLGCVTGEVGLGRAIKGVHFSDADDPVPYLTSESVLINSGRTWYQLPELGVWLVDRLASIDTAALVVSLGHFLDEVPAPVVERALELKLPVLTMPPGGKAREVLSYVYHALSSADLHQLRRTVAMQNDLLDLLLAEAGVDELIDKVSSLLGMPMMLLDGSGNVAHTRGCTDPQRRAVQIWEAWGQLTNANALGILEIGDSRYLCREVLLYGKVERLIVAQASRTASSVFADMALSFLQRLISLDLLKRRDEIVATRRLRRRLLRDLLSGAGAPEELTALVEEHGVHLDRPWRVAICEFGMGRRGGRTADELEDTMVEAVDTFCGDRLIAFLSRPQGTDIAVLLPDGYPSVGEGGARDLLLGLKSFCAAEPYRVRLAIGSSAAHTGAGAGPKAVQEAKDAVQLAVRGADAEGLVLFEELGARFRLLQGQSPDALEDIARRTVVPLLEYDARRHTHLMETLRTLLDNHFAVQPTAEALFIHRNTLQKRLRRIESLLGVDLTDIDDMMELYLGLRALQLIGEARALGTGPKRLPRSSVKPEG